MKVQLSILERILLSNTVLAPHTDKGITLRVIKRFRDELDFSEQEEQAWGITVDASGFKWADCEACKEAKKGKKVQCPHRDREFTITAAVDKVIKDHYEQLDKDGKLQLRDLSLAEKFCPHLFDDGSKPKE